MEGTSTLPRKIAKLSPKIIPFFKKKFTFYLKTKLKVEGRLAQPIPQVLLEGSEKVTASLESYQIVRMFLYKAKDV